MQVGRVVDGTRSRQGSKALGTSCSGAAGQQGWVGGHGAGQQRGRGGATAREHEAMLGRIDRNLLLALSAGVGAVGRPSSSSPAALFRCNATPSTANLLSCPHNPMLQCLWTAHLSVPAWLAYKLSCARRWRQAGT